MIRILMISSYVARDPVGITATTVPLQNAGIEVVAVPTIVLSNHPIRTHIAGTALEPKLVEAMIGALEDNGWLGSFDAVFSGYLPSAEHVAVVGDAVRRVRLANPAALYICDPIFGDDPDGHYIDAAAAAALRDRLVPIADVLTPNRFELGWLSGIDVQSIEDAVKAAHALDRPIVAATSIPDGPGHLANVLVTGGNVFIGRVEKLNDVPHGTGDVFAGFLVAQLLQGASADAALGMAVAGVRHALEVSRGSDRLMIALMDRTNGLASASIEKLR